MNTLGSPGEQSEISSMSWFLPWGPCTRVTATSQPTLAKQQQKLKKTFPPLQPLVLGAGDIDGKWGRNLLQEELLCLCLRMTRLQLPQDCPHAHHCHLVCFSQASSFVKLFPRRSKNILNRWVNANSSSFFLLSGNYFLICFSPPWCSI